MSTRLSIKYPNPPALTTHLEPLAAVAAAVGDISEFTDGHDNLFCPSPIDPETPISLETPVGAGVDARVGIGVIEV